MQLRTVVVLLALAVCALAQYDCPPPDLNDCTYANATDVTQMSDVTVYFASVYYDPPCIIVSVGQKVTFNGSYDSHPLQPGVANDTDLVASTDPNTPFYLDNNGAVVDTGDTHTYTFTASGAFPYYCQIPSHAKNGMRGVVYVDTGCVAPPVAPVAPPVAPPMNPPTAPVAAPVAAPKATPVGKKSDAAKFAFSAAAVIIGAALL